MCLAGSGGGSRASASDVGLYFFLLQVHLEGVSAHCGYGIGSRVFWYVSSPFIFILDLKRCRWLCSVRFYFSMADEASCYWPSIVLVVRVFVDYVIN